MESLHEKQFGWVNYLNALPLKMEIEKKMKFSWEDGHPSQINSALARGFFHRALSSSILPHIYPSLLRQGPPRLGIVGDRHIQSVYIALENPQDMELWIQQKAWREEISHRIAIRLPLHAEGKTPPPLFSVKFNPRSLSSNSLWKTLSWMMWGSSSSQEQLSQALLFMGDEALEVYDLFPHKIHLADLWYELTHQSFVFALWIESLNPMFPLSSEEVFILEEQGRLAEQRMKETPEIYQIPGRQHPNSIGSYWKTIRYYLRDEDFLSLSLFYEFFSRANFCR